MREYEEGYPVDANDRYYQGYHSDPERRNNSNFGFANVKRNAVPGGNKVREDATDYLNERLKVMPYESTEVLFDQRVEFVNDSEPAQIPQLLPFSVGDSVKVTWNGVEYECIAFDGSEVGEAGSAAIGNFPPVTGVDTGEPFMIATVPVAGLTVVFCLEEITEASVKIEGTVVKTIDPKFIPAGVGGGVVIVQDSAMASGVMPAEQAAPTATMNAAQIAEAVLSGKNVYFIDPNSQNLLPFVYGYRFGELANGVMTAVAAPDPYALFGLLDEDAWYHLVKVWSDGSYTSEGYGVMKQSEE